MSLPIERRIQLGFGLALVSLVAMGLVTLQSTAASARDALAVSGTLEALGHIREKAALISDAESGALGYVITGDSAFVALYDSSRQALPPVLARLRTYLRDDSDQQRRAESLGALVDSQLGRFDAVVALRRTRGAPDAAQEVLRSNGGATMGRIRALIESIAGAERAVLTARSLSRQRRDRQTRLVVWAGSLLGLVVVVAASGVIRKELGARRKAEERFKIVVDSVPGGVVMVSRDGRIVLVNQEVERLFGYPREELLGRPIEELVPERFRGHHPGFRGSFFAHPQTRSMGAGRDLFGLRRDGTEIPVEIGLNPIETDEGLFVLASVVDITERKRAEARFRTMVESAPSGMVMIDATGRITMVNREIERLFGYAREELLGESIDRLVPGRFRGAHPGFRAEFFANPHPRSMGAGRDLFGVRKNGTEVPVEIGLNPIAMEEGMFVLASVVDITARKTAETELRRSNEELERFAYVASHDLQEPLRMVGSYVQLLAKRYHGRLDADADVFIGYALDGALRMQQLIQDLLSYSRVGTRGAEPSPVDLNASLGRVLANLKLAIEEAEAAVTFDPLPTVLGDPGQLEHLLLNLISNGLKFRGAEPPRVHVSAVLQDDEWRFGVRDNGIGIDPQYFARIFVIFQRLHRREEYPGTGIGLAIAKKIVERHGGRIWVESVPGQGTTFFFTLQAVKGQP